MPVGSQALGYSQPESLFAIKFLVTICRQNRVGPAAFEQFISAGSQKLVVGVWLALVGKLVCASWWPNAGLLTAKIATSIQFLATNRQNLATNVQNMATKSKNHNLVAGI